MIQYLIAAGIGALVGSVHKRKDKKFATGGQIMEESRQEFKALLDSVAQKLDEADTILSRQANLIKAYDPIFNASIGISQMRRRTDSKYGYFYRGTPAMRGLLDDLTNTIEDLVIHVEDVKDIEGYNPDYALRRIGAAQRKLALVEREHEGRGMMADGGEVQYIDLVHAYDDDGSLFGTGTIEKAEGDKVFVRFDSQKVKAFDKDKVRPVMAHGGTTHGSAHDEMQALEKGDKIRITRLTDNRRTETPILLTLVRKGRVNKGKRNEQSKFKFENESGQTFFAYQRDGEKPRFALGDMAIVVSDEIDFSPKMAKGGKNEDAKKRFDVDFYKGIGDRRTSHEEIIRGDKFSDVVSKATKVAKSKGLNYVEFYHKDLFIGSIDKTNRYQFKKGRDYQKSPLSEKMAHGGEISLDILPEYRREQLLMYVTDRSIREMDLDGQLGALFEYGYHDIKRRFAGNDKALIKAYEDKTTFRLPTMEYIASEFAKGGKTQGYDDKLDESLAMRRGAGRTKEQGRKDRRDESAGMEKSMGRRKYASVGTMDKGSREMAKGGRITAPQPILDGKEFIALVVDKDGMPQMKFSKTFNGALRMAKNMTKKFGTGEYSVKKFDPVYGASFFEEGLFIEPTKSFDKGGKTKKRKEVSDFDKLAMKVAARYRAEGKSNEEAMEIGRGTAANVARQQQAKKGKK